MTKVLTILTVFLALLAVTVPSAAVASRGFVAHPAPLLQLQSDGSYIKAPCPMTGSARAPVCRPDIGVMPTMVFVTPPVAVPFPRPMTDAMPAKLAFEPVLPPPRSV
jgi:hypothetical protein